MEVGVRFKRILELLRTWFKPFWTSTAMVGRTWQPLDRKDDTAISIRETHLSPTHGFCRLGFPIASAGNRWLLRTRPLDRVMPSRRAWTLSRGPILSTP